MERYRRGHNGPDSKSGSGVTRSWVRIPPAPPKDNYPNTCAILNHNIGVFWLNFPYNEKSPLKAHQKNASRGFLFFIRKAPVLFNIKKEELSIGDEPQEAQPDIFTQDRSCLIEVVSAEIPSDYLIEAEIIYHNTSYVVTSILSFQKNSISF